MPRPLTLCGCFAIAALSVSPGCGKTPARPSGPALHEFRLVADTPEHPEVELLGPSVLGHRALLGKLDAIATDADARGVLLRLGPLGGSWARAADLGAALARIGAAGKPIHCHFEEADNLSYALMARHCDRIGMAPGGVLNLVGVSAEVMFARDLLERVGLTAELMQVGRFKGAADTFTANEMPAETRQTLDAILDQLQQTLRSALQARRFPEPDADLGALIDAGPFTARTARARGLVDAIGYDDAARATAQKAAGGERVEYVSQYQEAPHVGIAELLSALTSDASETRPQGDRLVVAYLTGTIMTGAPTSIRGADAEAFVRAMREFADDDEVRALVLRIDSPGGSAPASDRMWHALRRVAKRKPVIVSIGDMAASGGYYIAAAGTQIMARDDSLVGSIGVVGGKIVAQDLAERSGVHFERLQRGANAGWTSVSQRFSDREREAIRGLLLATYDLFLERVAMGRNLPVARIAASAEGRLMTGSAARQAGLVDAEGGLLDAIARAREAGGLDADAPIQAWPPQHSVLEQLAHGISGGPGAGVQLLARLASDAGGLRGAAAVEVLLGESTRIIAALPFAFQVR